MRNVLFVLGLAVGASATASAALIDVAGASVITWTSSSVQFAQPGGAAGPPSFTTFNCAPVACTAASLVASGTANAWDGAGDGITVTFGSTGTLTFTLTAAPVVTISGSGARAGLTGSARFRVARIGCSRPAPPSVTEQISKQGRRRARQARLLHLLRYPSSHR
jgi:hypothetical protein